MVQGIPAVIVPPHVVLPSVKSRPPVPCVTTWTTAFDTVAVAVKVTCCEVLQGGCPTPPNVQTLMLPKLGWPKFAVTLCAALIVTMHVALVPEPAQAPPQPRNDAPPPGVAVSVTAAPLS